MIYWTIKYYPNYALAISMITELFSRKYQDYVYATWEHQGTT